MLERLLKKGYLPGELPPLFSSLTLANCLVKHANNLPAAFTKNKAPWTIPAHHNLLRVGGLRRRLSTPNPYSFFRLASLFHEEAKELRRCWSSPYSRTLPRSRPNQLRALAPNATDRAAPQILARSGAKYLLRADVAQFYPSIYTHTISWVLHTKAVAKQMPPDKSLLGNRLDEELRAGQHGQTKGIPIGPDTSLGVSELLLSHIDAQIQERCKPVGGIRYIDDIEYSFGRLADAENALLILEGELFELELQLNSTKSGIVELPAEIEAAYVTELRARVPGDKATKHQWIGFFNRSFALSKQFPADGVLRYAVASLRAVRIRERHWELVQALMWQCVAGDPGCLRFVIDVLWNQTRTGGELLLGSDQARCALDALIARSAPIGHSSEVVWAIWAALLFEVKLSSQSTEAIGTMEDSFVASAASFAAENASILEPFPTNAWVKWFQPKAFADTHWLFAYEAYRRGWLPDLVKASDIAKDDTCRFLKKHGVTFINERSTSTFRPPRRPKPIVVSASNSPSGDF